MTYALPLWTMKGSSFGSWKWLGHIIMVTLLSLTLIVSGCSLAWVNTIDNILVAAAPALINILNIIAIAKGQPLNTSLAARITADAAKIKTLANDFATASAAAAPTACAQLQAAISIYSQDQAEVMSLANVTDQATQTKISVLSALVSGTVVAILGAIPSCQQAATMRDVLGAHAVPLPLKSFVKSYNENLAVPTSIPAVDDFTRSHRIHVHGKVLRVLSLGFAD